MVGMHMRFQDPFDLYAFPSCSFQDGVGRCRGSFTRAVIEIEDGIDHGRRFGAGVPHQITDCVGGLVEERLDGEPVGLGHLWYLASRGKIIEHPRRCRCR